MRKPLRSVSAAIFVAGLLAACGGSSSGGGSSSAAAPAGSATTAATPAITPPPAVASAGKILYCSDITYPPEEFYKGTTAVGSDIDIATEIARRMGVGARSPSTARPVLEAA